MSEVIDQPITADAPGRREFAPPDPLRRFDRQLPENSTNEWLRIESLDFVPWSLSARLSGMMRDRGMLPPLPEEQAAVPPPEKPSEPFPPEEEPSPRLTDEQMRVLWDDVRALGREHKADVFRLPPVTGERPLPMPERESPGAKGSSGLWATLFESFSVPHPALPHPITMFRLRPRRGARRPRRMRN